MKFNGKKPNKGNTVHCVIPRENGESIVFIANGIFDYSEFEKLFPEPKPAVVVDKGVQSFNYQHPKYREQLGKWVKYKSHWIALESLKQTPGIEWETVKMEDPETWGNYEKELKEILLPNEVTEVSNAVMDACALTNQKVEEATQAFLLGVGPDTLNLSSLIIEPETTPSSEPAKDSESAPSKSGETSQ